MTCTTGAITNPSDLEGIGAVRLLESLWAVTTPKDSGEIARTILAIMDHDDSLAIVEIKSGSEWSAVRARAAGVQWLQRRVRPYPQPAAPRPARRTIAGG